MHPPFAKNTIDREPGKSPVKMSLYRNCSNVVVFCGERNIRPDPQDLHLLLRVGAWVLFTQHLLKRIRKSRNELSAEKARAVFIRLLNPKPGPCVASCMCRAYPDLTDLCPARTLNAVKKKFYIALKRVGAWPSRISCKLSAAASF